MVNTWEEVTNPRPDGRLIFTHLAIWGVTGQRQSDVKMKSIDLPRWPPPRLDERDERRSPGRSVETNHPRPER